MNVNKKIKKMTLGAMLCALCVTLMLLCSVFEIADLSVAGACSIVILFAVLELRGAYPYLMWVVISVLSLLLVPNKFPAVCFALFFGWYPIAKCALDRLRAVIGWIVKIAVFLACCGAVYLIETLFITVPEYTQIWLLPPVLLTFVLFDVALTRLALGYQRVWKRKFKIDL